MADQKKWFKVWSTILIDLDHINLSLENVGRWTRLGAMIAATGTKGQITVKAPALQFLTMMNYPDLECAETSLKTLPNISVEKGKNCHGAFTVTMLNWLKYQVDYTYAERQEKSRNKCRDNNHRREKEEKEITKEEGFLFPPSQTLPSYISPDRKTPLCISPLQNLPPIVTPKQKTEWFEKLWEEYPPKGRLRKKEALRRFMSSVVNLETAKRCAQALERYIDSKRVKEGFIQNAPTWFGDWQSWENYTEAPDGTINC